MAEAQRLRIATFNIRHAAPEDSYRGRPDQLAESCRALDADILALQEVDVGVPRSRGADLAKVAAQACGMNYYFAKARKHAYRGQYGNALLARGTISDVEVVKLHGDRRHVITVGSLVLKPFREARNAIIARVTVRNHALSVATGHFATEPTVRQSQLTRVVERLLDRPEPRLLLGDFNIPWEQAAEWLRPYGLQLAEELLPQPDPALQTGIDHVAVDALLVERVETRRLPISDHEAKIVEVVVPG